MAAFTSIVVGALAAASAAGTIVSVNQRKKQARQQERQMRQQEIEAREAAAKQTTRDDTGAKVKLGSDDRRVARAGGSSPVGGARTGTVANSVGGLGASARLGL